MPHRLSVSKPLVSPPPPADFRSADFLRQQVLDTMAFYDVRCIDPAGGFYHFYKDDGSVYDATTRHLVSSARFVFTHAMAARHFPEHAQAAAWLAGARHGLDFLRQVHRDPTTGGYAWLLRFERGQATVLDATNHCYGLAFVLLAHAHALMAGIEAARAGLDETFELMESHFWEPANQLYADEADAQWCVSGYRGQNANMHACEAMLAAFDATGQARFLERAQLLADAVTRRLSALSSGPGTGPLARPSASSSASSSAAPAAPPADPAHAKPAAKPHGLRASLQGGLHLGPAAHGGAAGLIWEHYRLAPDGGWAPDWDYNRHDRSNIFRPWGYQPGHLAEWAKLLLVLERALDRAPQGTPDPPRGLHQPAAPAERALQPAATQSLLHRAQALFAAAVEHGWDRAHGGMAYGFAPDGSVCDGEKYHWVQAETLAAAALLAQRTGEGGYWDWYDRLWGYCWQHFVDHRYGAWFRILRADNAPFTEEKSPAGKVDYHNMGACYDVLAALGR
jgi:glucose-6-phosphate isomerase